MKKYFINLFPKPLSREEKIKLFIKAKGASIVGDNFDGKPFTPEEAKDVAEGIKTEVKQLLIERANRHKEYAAQLLLQAEHENSMAHAATQASLAL